MAHFGVILFFIMLATVLVFRLPLGIGMMSMGIVYLLYTGQNLKLVASNILSLYYNNYILIAVPLFLFTANVMNAGKITEKIFDFCDSLVGQHRGGLAYVNVVASLVFAGMSGSATADASGLGNMEITEMRKKGYPDGFSCAITAASAILSPIFPPSITMLLHSSLSGAPVGKLFMGGMVPAVLMVLILYGYIRAIAYKRNFPMGKHYAAKLMLTYIIEAIPALLTPVILLGGIYLGVVTPTEAGALAGVYALLVSFIVYRALSLKEFIKVLKDTVKGIGTVVITVGCASMIQYIAGYEKIPALFAEFVLQLNPNKYMFLILVNVMFLIMGMFLETNTMTLVFIPMVLPLVQAFGIDLVHFGVVFCINMMIGMLSPPYGQLLFVTSAVSGVKIVDIIKELLPMIGLLVIFVFIVTFVPGIVTLLPDLLL